MSSGKVARLYNEVLNLGAPKTREFLKYLRKTVTERLYCSQQLKPQAGHEGNTWSGFITPLITLSQPYLIDYCQYNGACIKQRSITHCALRATGGFETLLKSTRSLTWGPGSILCRGADISHPLPRVTRDI